MLRPIIRHLLGIHRIERRMAQLERELLEARADAALAREETERMQRQLNGLEVVAPKVMA